MFDIPLRKLKDDLLNLILGSWSKRISPNFVTSISFIVGLLTAWGVWMGWRFEALGLWVFNRILDGLDGAIARKYNKQGDFGGYYDLLTDFAVYAVIPLAIVLRAQELAVTIAALVMLSVFYVNAASWMVLSAILEKPKYKSEKGITTVVMPVGLVEGAETILFYTAFILWPYWALYLFYAMAALTFMGIFQRLFWARRHLK